jgi:hypothetical protein
LWPDQIEERPGQARAEDRRAPGGQQEDAVAAGQLALRQELGQEPVLAGARQCAERAHQAEDHQQGWPSAVGQGQAREQHHGDLDDLERDQHTALAEGVGQRAGWEREQHVRQRVGQEALEGDGLLRGLRAPRTHQEQDHDHLEEVVVEHPQRLRADETQQGTRGRRGVHGGWSLTAGRASRVPEGEVSLQPGV